MRNYSLLACPVTFSLIALSLRRSHVTRRALPLQVHWFSYAWAIVSRAALQRPKIIRHVRNEWRNLVLRWAERVLKAFHTSNNSSGKAHNGKATKIRRCVAAKLSSRRISDPKPGNGAREPFRSAKRCCRGCNMIHRLCRFESVQEERRPAFTWHIREK